MAALNMTAEEMCQIAIKRVINRISNEFPQYPAFPSIFESQCEEEAYDEIDILLDDLKDGYSESALLDTIADMIDIKEEDQEALCSAIHNVLSTFTLSLTLNIVDIDMRVKDEEIKKMKATVEKTAFFFMQKMKDKNLLKVFVIGKKHFYPLLTYLLDTFSRYRLSKYIALYQELAQYHTKRGYQSFIADINKHEFDVRQFKQECDAFKALKRTTMQKTTAYTQERRAAEHALLWFDSSLNSVFRRGPMGFPLRMNPCRSIKVDDSMIIYAKYYISMLKAVQQILDLYDDNNINAILPLQIDLWLIPKAMKLIPSDDMKSEDLFCGDDDYDDEEDDDDDDDDEEDEESAEICVDHFETRLKHTDNLVTNSEVDPEADVNTLAAMLCDTYKKVVRGQGYKRMVLIIDRREDNEKDSLYAYLPKRSQDIPRIRNEYLQESLFNLSRVEIIPSENGKVDYLDKNVTNNSIHIKTDVDNMLFLSIHIHSANAIRAYWYFNGSYTRWFVRDMIDIWPLHFVDTKQVNQENGAPIHQDVKPIIELLTANANNLPLKDDDFDIFFEQNTKIKPSETYYKPYA